MKRWLEENPLGIALASVCGGLVVVALLLFVVWALPPSAPDRVSNAEDEPGSLELPELAPSEPIERYAVVTERPVFNESREPEIEADLADESADEELIEEPVEAPEVELAGVVITPSLKLATLRRKDDPVSLVAFEGKPLEGDYGTWHISRIGPREVTLASADGEEIELELQVYDKQMKPPPALEAQADAEAGGESTAAASGESDEPLSRAEEIRQRIAERREELRRAAEAAEQEESEGGRERAKAERKESEAMDYRTAIRSMIRGSREKQAEEE